MPERIEHVHGKLTTRQLAPRTWPDFDRFFAANGGVWGGCWCMFFQKPAGFEVKEYESNRNEKRKLTAEGRAHGTLVYCGDEPVGWCQFGPRDELPRIDRKRGYKPASEDPWRITCLFIDRHHRKKGVAKLAVKDSVAAMKKLEAQVVEAYPVEGQRSATLLWSGTPSLFEEQGFKRVGPLGKSSWVYSLAISS